MGKGKTGKLSSGVEIMNGMCSACEDSGLSRQDETRLICNLEWADMVLSGAILDRTAKDIIVQ